MLGHSDGATIALEFAAAFPQALSALILMAPHVFVEDEAIAAIDEANLAYDKGELRTKLERYHGDNVDNAFRGWCDTWFDPAFRSWDMRSALKNIQAPTLQFQGSADEYGTLAQTQSIESENGGRVTTVIFDDCGHSPHQDKPAETLNEIVNFIKTLKAKLEILPNIRGSVDITNISLSASRCYSRSKKAKIRLVLLIFPDTVGADYGLASKQFFELI